MNAKNNITMPTTPEEWVELVKNKQLDIEMSEQPDEEFFALPNPAKGKERQELPNTSRPRPNAHSTRRHTQQIQTWRQRDFISLHGILPRLRSFTTNPAVPIHPKNHRGPTT